MNSDLAPDHDRESLEFEREFQKMVNDIFDLSHGQDIDTLNILSIITSGGAGPIITAPQLPVLALKPDRLSFSMSTANLHIWKEAYRSYHRATEFDRYPTVKQQAFLFRCLHNEVAIRLHREATNNMPIFSNNNTESCEWIINTAFHERHPLHQRRQQFINFQQSTTQDALEACEHLFIIMKEADIDRMGQEDIACIIMQNCC